MVVVGIILPLDFLMHVDGFIVYLHAWEVFAIYGMAYFVYATIALLLGVGMVILSMPTAIWGRQSFNIWYTKACTFLNFTLISITLLISFYAWLKIFNGDIAQWMKEYKTVLVAILILINMIWVWNHTQLPQGIETIIHAGTKIGALVFLVTLVMIGFFSTVHTDTSKPLAITAATKAPNIILLTIDTLAANHTSLYGYQKPTTPNIVKLSQQAIVFDRYYANSNFTTSSINSLLHGVRPWTHRALQIQAVVDPKIAANGLVSRLKDSGYQTLAVSTNNVASPSHVRATPYFDRIVYGRENSLEIWLNQFIFNWAPDAISLKTFYWLNTLYSIVNNILYAINFWSLPHSFDPELAFFSARQLIETRSMEKPMFLWVHIFPPHGPYVTPKPFLGHFDTSPFGRTRNSNPPDKFMARFDRNFPDRYAARYDEAVLYVDHHVGLFIDWLKDKGLDNNTLLVISSDHGESFSHGYGGHCGPLLHNDLIRVPLIIKRPGQMTGQRVDSVSEQIDLMPTILDLAGILPLSSMEGRSLKPTILGNKTEKPIFSMNFEQSNRFGKLDRGSVAMIDGHWKYVHYLALQRYPKIPDLKDALYNLETDSEEMLNQISEYPVIASRMHAMIEDQLHRFGAPLQ